MAMRRLPSQGLRFGSPPKLQGHEMVQLQLSATVATRCQLGSAARRGDTLGRLQKVRTDVERLISTSINVLFTSLVGIVFVMIYAFSVHWIIAPAYFLTVPLLGILSSVLSRRIKQIQKVIVAETPALAGSTTESLRNSELVKGLGVGQQEIARLNGTMA